MTDIEIAREAQKQPIQEIGAKLGIPSDHLLPYGHDKAKVSQDYINSVQSNENGKLILVTAINPTPAGEGKTTTTVGLGDGLNRMEHMGAMIVHLSGDRFLLLSASSSAQSFLHAVELSYRYVTG